MLKSQIKQVYSGKSRKLAILLFCRECMGYDRHRKNKLSMVSYKEASTEATHCRVKNCPLWPYRKATVVEPTEVPSERT